MPNQATRLRPAQIQTDRDAFAALKVVTGYAPANPAYALTTITAAEASLAVAQQAEAQAAAAAAAARDNATAREWEFHNLMLGAKDQIIAQFGKDSNEVQALGLKKKSEYSRPKPRPKTGGTPS
jgi:DNA-binding GntR family transcriptional regulator